MLLCIVPIKPWAAALERLEEIKFLSIQTRYRVSGSQPYRETRLEDVPLIHPVV
jgi:hypothetical protein